MLRRSFRLSTVFNPSYSTHEVRRTFKYEPDLLYKSSTKQSTPRLEGFIKSWHFVERCGEFEVINNNNNDVQIPPQIYAIRNAQSFETIMPTSHRTLIGTKVSFTPVIEEVVEE